MKILHTTWLFLICAVTGTTMVAQAQNPVITPGGIVNAASFAANQPVAPGSLVSIYGTKLAPSLQVATTIPLPKSLNTVSVTFNGIPAPLLFVSSGQINAQVPWEAGGSASASVVVTVNGTPSAAISTPLASLSPGLFTVEFGIGKAIAINQDGSLAQPQGSIPGIVSHPAKPGDTIILLGTGFGPSSPAAVTGNNSLDTLRTNTTTPVILIGGIPAAVAFSGMSPQFVGVNQINVVVPSGVASGVVSLQAQEGGVTTTARVTMAITGGSGGGDTQPPSVPTNLSATVVSSSQINLAWTASTDNVGVVGYKVFRNSTQVATITGTSYSDTGLAASTAYTYTVEAYDAAGNNSAQSASVSATTSAGGSAQVPTEYQDLYTQIQNNLNSFQGTVESQWNGQKGSTLFSADVFPAYSGASGILNPGYYDSAVTPFLNSLQKLGVKAVKVAIAFPILYQPFHDTVQANTPNAYQQYLAFYQKLVNDVHIRGMKFIAHCQVVHTGGTIPVTAYYDGLTWDQYIAGRSAQIQTVARELKPDYIAIQTEPDTEAANSGKTEVNTTSGYQQLLSTILSDLRSAGLHTMPVTAGIGTWIPNWQAMTNVLTGLSDLDMVDLHIYPANTLNGTNYLNVALQVADMAHAAGKKVSMTECWLYKVRDTELTQGFTSDQIYGRDVYSFWAPLDQQFLKVMAEMGWWKQLEFVSPYPARYFNAYLDYNQVTASGCGVRHQTCDTSQLFGLANQALSEALAGPQFTSTGSFYQSLIH